MIEWIVKRIRVDQYQMTVKELIMLIGLIAVLFLVQYGAPGLVGWMDQFRPSP
jgi:hypothetical protein